VACAPHLRKRAFVWGALFLGSIPIFAGAYTFFPDRSFYSGNTRLEPAFTKEVEILDRELSRSFLSSLEKNYTSEQAGQSFTDQFPNDHADLILHPTSVTVQVAWWEDDWIWFVAVVLFELERKSTGEKIPFEKQQVPVLSTFDFALERQLSGYGFSPDGRLPRNVYPNDTDLHLIENAVFRQMASPVQVKFRRHFGVIGDGQLFRGKTRPDTPYKNMEVVSVDDAQVPMRPEVVFRILRVSANYDGVLNRSEQTYGRMLYFSVVTATTLGYGDIVPLRGTARLCIGMQAIMGLVWDGLFLNTVFRSSQSVPQGANSSNQTAYRTKPNAAADPTS
jgi:hypothetical protein